MGESLQRGDAAMKYGILYFGPDEMSGEPLRRYRVNI